MPKEHTQDVILRSRAEVLFGYHNAHLQMMLAAALNVLQLADIPDKEVVMQNAVKVPGSPVPVMREVTAKQQRDLETKTMKDNLGLLTAIEVLLEVEGKPVPEETKAQVLYDRVIEKVTPAKA